MLKLGLDFGPAPLSPLDLGEEGVQVAALGNRLGETLQLPLDSAEFAIELPPPVRLLRLPLKGHRPVEDRFDEGGVQDVGSELLDQIAVEGCHRRREAVALTLDCAPDLP